MADVVYLGGVDADALGLSITGLPDAWSAPPSPWETLGVPRYAGARLRRATPDVGPRTLVVEGIVRAATAVDAEVSLQALKDAVSERSVPIRYGYQPDRQYWGVLQGFGAGLFAPGNLGGWASVQLSFLLADPYAVDIAPTLATGGAGVRVPIALGTGPTYVYAEVLGPATTPVLTYRDHAGRVIGTFTGNASLSDSTALVVDGTDGGDAWVRNGAGARTPVLLTASAGYRFPVFSPRDGVRGMESWPTIETSTGTLSVTYARRWA
jgi:hypothetical protein